MLLDSKAFVKSLRRGPGVYVMRDSDAKPLYVGKARNLKNRLKSYFHRASQSGRTGLMVAKVTDVEIHVTTTETEALLLESNLIKSLKPRYNVLLRDDKSYPYLRLSVEDQYPGLAVHRGATSGPGQFFGPYANVGAIRLMLNQLQKIIPIRQCDNNYFRNRSRPCLQYQIKRCSAPCVGNISPEAYGCDVRHVVMLLEGHDKDISRIFAADMDRAAQSLEYEQAARYRDKISALRKMQERQYVAGGTRDADVATLLSNSRLICFSVMSIRHGQNIGSKHFISRDPLEAPAAEMLSTLLVQYYRDRPVPAEVLVTPDTDTPTVLAALFSEKAGRRVTLKHRVRGFRARWLELALLNATDYLDRHLASEGAYSERLRALGQVFELHDTPTRIECFDTSHTAGEHPVAACVVFDSVGPVTAEYRRFNIRNVAAGDDYGAMAQVIRRRFRKVAEGAGVKPDLVLIDGGAGQVAKANEALSEYLLENIPVAGIAKGRSRKPGRERLFLPGRQRPLVLDSDSPALLLLQQIRDEAHRFAITGHRKKRTASRTSSALEQIPGVGAKRRQALLNHFGGLQQVRRAAPEDLAGVTGISLALANRIYQHYRVH